ncbi:hypothetical protein D3879_04920 [Pseudomonas cavernicola]|uniref:Uncharacterized protein n=1 Tax=Pseudomonas cavernicola TaxID=2320866 RepID=A0A418XJH7_9PSED|nr:hypothetical protein D3879_04920 [Pseudomonas cavernicola]
MAKLGARVQRSRTEQELNMTNHRLFFLWKPAAGGGMLDAKRRSFQQAFVGAGGRREEELPTDGFQPLSNCDIRHNPG